MAKGKTRSDKRRTSSVKEPASDRWVKRDAIPCQFTLGRSAFGKISEIEGIVLSRGMKADLRWLDGVSSEKRRAMLAQKYGKR
jgi:hypothetical protein